MLKKRILFFSILLTMVLFFSLAGCSARTPISADEFSKQAKDLGFTVTEQSATNTAVVKYLQADDSKTQTQLIFITFKTESDAQTAYTSVKANVSQGTGAKTTTLDSSSYNKFTVVNGELNYTIIRMNDTLLYGKANSGHQNQVDDFVKAAKY